MTFSNRREPRVNLVLCCIGAGMIVLGIGVRRVTGATPEEVDGAVGRATGFLYGRMHGDNWEAAPKPTDDGNASVTGRQWGGLTAISTYALLAAGENPQTPKLQAAIEWLKDAPIGGHYASGLRAQVWTFLKDAREARRASTADFRLLLHGLLDDRDRLGLYSYYTDLKTGRPQAGWWDHSVSQYGVLGVWACEQAGQEVPTLYWKVVDARWRHDQLADGGWAYRTEGQSKGTMTAAGIATLFITQDYLLAGQQWSRCRGGKRDPDIEKGLAWMDRHAPDMLRGGDRYYYGLYGIERIGAASGRKYFGTTDWYQVGADSLVKKQKPDGSWGDVPDTCFGLLFLARGRGAVVMNKLEYANLPDARARGAEPQAEPWNERPRDVANFVQWSGRQVEQSLNWQVVNLKVSAAGLQDAPILYIAGSEALRLDDDAVGKLRQYVEDGGLILGNADCASRAFTKSFIDLGNKAFPKYEFRDLPDDSVIYTDEQFRRSRWRVRPEIQGLSNGVRELMVLAPTADPGRSWQTRSEQTHEVLFQLTQNVLLYAVDKGDLKTRGETHLVAADGRVKADRRITVVRADIGDNPDPEPAGWRRLGNILHNQYKLDLDIRHAKLGEGKLAGAKLVALTGTTGFTLRPEQQQELKEFVAAGGTVVVDAAGGSGVFADAAEAALAETFGATLPDIGPILPPDHPLYVRDGAKIDRFTYRDFARGRLLGRLNAPRVRGIEQGGRLAVLYSREDLSAGLVGEPVDGVLGYSPQTATEIMRNIVLYAAEK